MTAVTVPPRLMKRLRSASALCWRNRAASIAAIACLIRLVWCDESSSTSSSPETTSSPSLTFTALTRAETEDLMSDCVSVSVRPLTANTRSSGPETRYSTATCGAPPVPFNTHQPVAKMRPAKAAAAAPQRLALPDLSFCGGTGIGTRGLACVTLEAIGPISSVSLEFKVRLASN